MNQGRQAKNRPHPLPRPVTYPPVRVIGTDPENAALLVIDLAGPVSEPAAVTQYLYHPAELNRCTAGVEMHHIHLRGKSSSCSAANRVTAPVNEREVYWTAATGGK